MNIKGISKDTWVRLIFVLVALVNVVSYIFVDKEIFPWNDNAIYEAATAIVTVLATIIGTWKNNSVTEHAQAADDFLDNMRHSHE